MEGKQSLVGRPGEVYESILLFAHGKRYVMRAPVRLWFELAWNDRIEKTMNITEVRTKSQKKARQIKFGHVLQDLERHGYIRRIGMGCIEVLENDPSYTAPRLPFSKGKSS